ncbi:HdeD protein (plasmid) [Legionella adelaidensis]|uniref:Acid-resistance membrane protein n=1 Tax=Legionella adelaidensis TaxID=45056 RepID=A0A0W0R0H7_9GAMM|nr:DUF308 domain-containing protein [Legionella adelaidensis]KTC64541.1 acid-resistance membrane protein [Legionella adelaidensis]VEH85908.1 HdeD protein [Legionella adelaidensis]
MPRKKVEALPIVSRNWAWLLTLGILFVVLGAIGLGMVIGLTLASMMFLGVLLLIAGIIQIVDVFKSRGWEGVLWHAFVAVLYLIAGGLVIYEPFLASSIITAMLAGVLIIIGITRFFMAIALRHTRGWVWLLLAGLIAFILGILILSQWPWSGLWFIGLFIAIELMMAGWTYIFLALSLR